MINFSQILNDLKEFANSEEPLDLLLFAVNETKADFENRIFNSESGTKTKTGKQLKGYSKEYAKYRQKHGRQSKVVDLEFTGALRRDLKVVRTEQSIKMQYLSKKEIEKIVHLEKHFAEPIFELSAEEEKAIKEKATNLFAGAFKEIIKNGQNNK